MQHSGGAALRLLDGLEEICRPGLTRLCGARTGGASLAPQSAPTPARKPTLAEVLALEPSDADQCFSLLELE
jgi:hypothetical protein